MVRCFACVCLKAFAYPCIRARTPMNPGSCTHAPGPVTHAPGPVHPCIRARNPCTRARNPCTRARTPMLVYACTCLFTPTQAHDFAKAHHFRLFTLCSFTRLLELLLLLSPFLISRLSWTVIFPFVCSSQLISQIFGHSITIQSPSYFCLLSPSFFHNLSRILPQSHKDRQTDTHTNTHTDAMTQIKIKPVQKQNFWAR